MKALLDDLLDFNRTNLGLGINLIRTNVNLAQLFADELDRLRAALPGRQIDLEVRGDTRGFWDGGRLQQVLGNLVLNAIKYGTPGAPVHVVIDGADGDVRFEVRNQGPAIEQSALVEIFEPLRRASGNESGGNDSLGLGLYISREIAKGHGGEIAAASDGTETFFAVRLPRRA